jgi:hypothetical protein
MNRPYIKKPIKEHFGLFFAQIFIAGWKRQEIGVLQARIFEHIRHRRRQKRDGSRVAVLSFDPLFGK